MGRVPSTLTCPSGLLTMLPTWIICSMVPNISTRICPSGTWAKSPTCVICSVAPNLSTRTCPSGTWAKSSTCPRCSKEQHLLSRYYAVRRGLIQRHGKVTYFVTRQGPSQQGHVSHYRTTRISKPLSRNVSACNVASRRLLHGAAGTNRGVRCVHVTDERDFLCL